MEKLDEKIFRNKIHAISEKLSINNFISFDDAEHYEFDVCDEKETYIFKCTYLSNIDTYYAYFCEDEYDFEGPDLKSLLIKVYIYIVEAAARCGRYIYDYENGKWKLFSECMHEVLDF